VSQCETTRDNLSAYRDGELAVADHVDIVQHLRDCPACRVELEELTDLGVLLRRHSTDLSAEVGGYPQRHGLTDAVVSRVLAEEAQSWPTLVRRAFDDMHLVWAGLCATSAVVVCAALSAALVLLAPAAERGDSLRAMLAMLASPGTNLDPLPLAHGVEAPRVSPEAITPLMLANDLSLASDEEVELAISAVVTREGRVARTELLEGVPNQRLVQSLEDSARFQPASRAGTPVAVSLVWLLSHTTVRPDIVKPQSAVRAGRDVST